MKKCIKRIAIMSLVILAIYGYKKQADIAEAQQLQQSISEKILRFHVLANSDREEDQQVKLQVRDAIGEYIEPLIADSTDLEETESIVNDNLSQIVDVAEKTLEEAGYTYGATAKLTDCDFPVKTYGEYTFPAGEYRALEVSLGQGEGHNWWCVLYPPLCFVDATYGVLPDESKDQLKNILTEDEYNAITETQCHYRFKYMKFLNWIFE